MYHTSIQVKYAILYTLTSIFCSNCLFLCENIHVCCIITTVKCFFVCVFQNGMITEALEGLLSLEKQTRTVSCHVCKNRTNVLCLNYNWYIHVHHLKIRDYRLYWRNLCVYWICLLFLKASDAISTARVLKAVVQLCFDAQEWELLNDHIMLLTKRRSQLKTVSKISFVLLYSLAAATINLSSSRVPLLVEGGSYTRVAFLNSSTWELSTDNDCIMLPSAHEEDQICFQSLEEDISELEDNELVVEVFWL